MAIVPTQKVQLLERMLYFLPFSITAGPVLINRTDYEICPVNRVTPGGPTCSHKRAGVQTQHANSG